MQSYYILPSLRTTCLIHASGWSLMPPTVMLPHGSRVHWLLPLLKLMSSLGALVGGVDPMPQYRGQVMTTTLAAPPKDHAKGVQQRQQMCNGSPLHSNGGSLAGQLVRG